VLGLVLLGLVEDGGLVAAQSLELEVDELGVLVLPVVCGKVLGVRAGLDVELVVFGNVLVEVLAVEFRSQFRFDEGSGRSLGLVPVVVLEVPVAPGEVCVTDGAVCIVVDVEGVVGEVLAPVADGMVDVALGVVVPVWLVPVVVVLVWALSAPAVANSTENSRARFIKSSLSV